MLKVGLTGGMGVGKSVVAARFAERGARVVTADEVSRFLVEPGSPVLDLLVSSFGPGILRDDGTLDRRALAEAAFESEEGTRTLNAIVHPPLVSTILNELRAATGPGIIVVDAALLGEWGILDAFDTVIVVTAPLDARLDRLVASGYRRTDAERRIAAQMSEEKLAERADVVIENDGSIDDLGRIVDEVWSDLESRQREVT